MGPTASGKTDLAIELAGAGLRADQCRFSPGLPRPGYRQCQTGLSAPPGGYPRSVEAYSAADFVGDASRLAADITARGRTPLLVGGTMLVFQGLSGRAGGYASRGPADPARRSRPRPRQWAGHNFMPNWPGSTRIRRPVFIPTTPSGWRERWRCIVPVVCRSASGKREPESLPPGALPDGAGGHLPAGSSDAAPAYSPAVSADDGRGTAR